MLTPEALDILSQSEAITAANSVVDSVDSTAVALPESFKLHDLEPYKAHRRHARGNFDTSRIGDFAAYVAAHREEGATVFVADTMQATAVLNLGVPTAAGHADNTATLTLKPMAAFQALLNITGKKLSQRDAAEFLEDWSEHITCKRGEDTVALGLAISALRKLTIEASRKAETTVKSFGQQATAFESVEASSADPLPDYIFFKCVPYLGLETRYFAARLGVLTGEAAPAIVLRVARMEQHTEEMRTELAQLVAAAMEAECDTVSVVLGSYRKLG